MKKGSCTLLLLAVALLAGCPGEEYDFTGLPPESYWVVKQTFEAKTMPAGEPDCAPMTVTQPAKLTFTAPDVVTLSTLKDRYLLNDGATTPTGKVTSDGSLTFFADDTRYEGRFNDPDHFSVTSRTLRKYPGNGCPVRVTAYRYPGPRMCEVTTEEEEAALAAEAREAVADSNIDLVKTFFSRPDSWSWVPFYLSATRTGEYAQAGTWWTLTAPGEVTRFHFADGAVLTVDAFRQTLVHPDGWELVIESNFVTWHVTLDGEWRMDYENTFLMDPAPTQTVGVFPSKSVLRGYDTPIGTLTWDGTSSDLQFAIRGAPHVTTTALSTTLANAGTTKKWNREQRDTYCPFVGHGLYDAFPNLLQELVPFCATTPLYGVEVECMLVGP